MKKQFLFLSAIACSSLLLAQAPATILVTEDTYVQGSAKAPANADGSGSDAGGFWDISYGDQQYIITMYNDGYNTKKMGFLKFDLSSLAAVDFSTVTSVKLKMYYEYMTETNGDSQNMKVFNMNLVPDTETLRDSWTEETLTFNLWKGDANVTNHTDSLTKYSGKGGVANYYFRRNPDNTNVASYGGNAAYLIAQRTLTDEEEGQWIEWDITVAAAANKGGNLVLQVIGATQVSQQDIAFRSKEYGDGDYAPYLEISYEQPWTVTRSAATIADTYLSGQGVPAGQTGDEPYGDDDEICAMYNHAPTHSRRALLKFDIPYNPALIEAARLYVFGKVSNGEAVGQNKTYPGTAKSATFHVYNMNYFMHNQTQFTPYVYDWNEDITFSDWTNGQTDAANMLLTQSNPFYSRRNPDENQNNNVAGGRYGVPGTEQGKFGQEQVEVDAYKWYFFNLDPEAASSILNYASEPLSLQICGYGGDQNAPLDYIPFYIHSKENTSGNAPYLHFKMRESDLLLSEIQVGGTAIDPFDPYITEYTVVIPNNASEAPSVTGTLETAGAGIAYTQASSVNGTATIQITSGAETLVYSITFDPSGMPTSMDNLEKTIYSLSGNRLLLSGIDSPSLLSISDISGRFISQNIVSGSYEYIFPAQGVYLVSLKNAAGSHIRKIVIK